MLNCPFVLTHYHDRSKNISINPATCRKTFPQCSGGASGFWFCSVDNSDYNCKQFIKSWTKDDQWMRRPLSASLLTSHEFQIEVGMSAVHCSPRATQRGRYLICLGLTNLGLLLAALLVLSANAEAGNVRAAEPALDYPHTAITETLRIHLPLLTKSSGGELPSITCFNANPATVTPGGASVLSWCVTNAVSMTLNPAGVTTSTTTVTVTGGGLCGNIGALQAWEGTMGISYSRNASNADEAISMQRGGNVAFHLEKSGSGSGGASWIGFATGNLNINDRHDFFNPPPPQVSTIIGSGQPITLVQGIEEHSRVGFNVRYSDCTYNFTFDPVVEATETDPNTPPFQIEAPAGSLRSANRNLTPGMLSGSLFFSAHTLLWPDDGSDVYFPPWPVPGGLFPSEESLGSAHVNWNFEHSP
jgi:hypothetical protein